MAAMLDDSTPRALQDLEVLADPVRRRLYQLVLDRPEAVSRDEAASAAGIGRPLAAHHLDRLVTAGLLVAEYRRRTGRTGPGAGRPAKFYRPSGRELHATLPERRYEVAADLFATALDAGSRPHAGEALERAARSRGQELGGEARRRSQSRSPARRREALVDVLRDAGYAPFEREGELRMLNCPFHELAQRHRTVTCGMNLARLRGMMAGAGLPEGQARLDQQPGLCCVVIATRS
jgi:predicted ArsR family transcriptional regulator